MNRDHYRDDLRAHQYYKKASAIYEITKPSSDVLAVTYYNIGVTCSRQGAVDEARQYFEKALVMLRREAPGSMPWQIPTTHWGILGDKSRW
jgi:Tfp pilus assembly protein PilF